MTWWRLGWLLAAGGVLVGVGAGGPVLGRSGWTILWLVVGAALAAGGVALALEGHARAGGLTQAGRAFPVGVAAFVMVATLGLVTTPVIGGRPVLTNSQEAQLAEFSETMIDRLYKLGEIDELMALDQVQGRLHTTTLEAHYLEVERWAVEYASMKPEDLAVPELSEPHLSMEQTVDQALAAIDQHLRWLKTGDPVAHRVASEHRQAMASGVLRTGRLIGEVAFNYGVPVGEHEGGLVE